MTKERSVEELKRAQVWSMQDAEAAHINADNVLCLRLIELGEHEVVDEYQKVRRFYS